jgi:hypothetical protein
VLQVHQDDSFLTFVRQAGLPTDATTPPTEFTAAVALDAAMQIAGETGQPVIGPPMDADEATAIRAAG